MVKQTWTDDQHQALKRRDSKAFQRAFETYQGFVRYVGLTMGLDAARAEDLVQDVFVKLWHHAENLENAAGLQAWLAITARHTVHDGWRKHRKELTQEADDVVARQDELDRMELAALLQEKALADDVQDVVTAVETEAGYKTLTEFYWQGLSVAEIAAQEQQALSTITTRLTRMRRRFKELLLQKG